MTQTKQIVVGNMGAFHSSMKSHLIQDSFQGMKFPILSQKNPYESRLLAKF